MNTLERCPPNRYALAALVGVCAWIGSLPIGAGFTLAARIATRARAPEPAPVMWSYSFDERIPSPSGERIAVVAKRSDGRTISRTLAVSQAESHTWSVPYDWSRFEVGDVRWLDEHTLEITGTELVKDAVRERLELDLGGTVVVCRECREGWKE